MAFVGLIIIVVGSLLSWVGSFLLYGFGQLIENSDVLAEQSYRSNQKYNQAQAKADKAQAKAELTKVKARIRDDNIDEEEFIDIVCPMCGEQLSYMKCDFLRQDTLECPVCDAKISTKEYRC